MGVVVLCAEPLAGRWPAQVIYKSRAKWGYAAVTGFGGGLPGVGPQLAGEMMCQNDEVRSD